MHVPRRGPCAFGAPRPRGRRCAGVTIHWPRGAKIVAPVDGTVVQYRRWTDDSDAIILRTQAREPFEEYFVLLDCYSPTDRHTRKLPGTLTLAGASVLVSDDPDRRHMFGLYVAIFACPPGFTDGDLDALFGRGEHVWMEQRPVPPLLRDPTPWLCAADCVAADGSTSP